MKALRDVFGDTLVALGWTNPNAVVLDADLANSTKADKFAIAYPDRFLQMGIAEQNFVGVAVGLASVGFVRGFRRSRSSSPIERSIRSACWWRRPVPM